MRSAPLIPQDAPFSERGTTTTHTPQKERSPCGPSRPRKVSAALPHNAFHGTYSIVTFMCPEAALHCLEAIVHNPTAS